MAVAQASFLHDTNEQSCFIQEEGSVTLCKLYQYNHLHNILGSDTIKTTATSATTATTATKFPVRIST
jgi:hypothetical protein